MSLGSWFKENVSDPVGDAARDLDPTANTSYVGKKLGTTGTKLVRMGVATAIVPQTGYVALADEKTRRDYVDGIAFAAKTSAQAAGLPSGIVPGPTSYYYGGGGGPPPDAPPVYVSPGSSGGGTTVIQTGGATPPEYEGLLEWLLRLLRAIFGA